MMVEERQLKIRGVIQDIALARDFIAETATRAGLDDQLVHHCQLAVDEICTNVIEHGYGDLGANHSIELICRLETHQFTIIIVDDSHAFDPLKRPDPDPDASLHDREAGGWGIFFVKRMMDEVTYHHDGNQNYLRMVKHLKKSG
jgi:serine/threonine-protein kinase RsbW